MARKKVKLSLIVDDAKRKVTFNKRKKGLLNKVSELSILCGINACAIVFSPYDLEPEVWPSALGVQRLISQFNRIPEMEKAKKMLNQETFLRQRIAKVNEHLKKQQTQNREKEMIEFMFQCLLTGKSGMIQKLMLPDLSDLGCKIDQKLDEINKRMENTRNPAAPQQVAPLPPPPPLPQPQLLIPIALEPIAPPPLQPLLPIVTDNQMVPNTMQVQEHGHLQKMFNNWANQPFDDMGYEQKEESLAIMPSTNNSTAAAWFGVSNDQGCAHLANPWDFL